MENLHRMLCNDVIIIHKTQPFSCCLRKGRITCTRNTLILLREYMDKRVSLRILLKNLPATILRTIVNANNLDGAIILLHNAVKGFWQITFCVIDRN